VDCITTKGAIAAHYASGIFTIRAITTDAVAATAVRIACVIEGRFFSSQAHSFMQEIIFAAGLPWQGRNRLSLKR